MSLTSIQIDSYIKNGYLVIDNFLSHEQCDILKKRAIYLCKQLDFDSHPKSKFICGHEADSFINNIQSNYFLNSGDKIRYFFEDDSIDNNGQLLYPIENAINKIGHAIHALDSDFKMVTHSEQIKNIVHSLKIEKPKIIQSMYIFKQPKIGGKVNIHIDSTFLYTTPPSALLGLWIPIDDATLDNGCLWFIPGSHLINKEVNYRMIRENNGKDVYTKYIGEVLNISEESNNWVPVEVKRGSLVLISGQVVHKSEANKSDKARHAYTFHIYESNNTEYSSQNWLQPSELLPFPLLYDN